ncbi:MAG: ABC transporter substrate-binding protein [Myxococcaceae bacterium]|nr:ABC transporter substrate-binding protein [Myxococcaceae bacterium]
MNKVVTSVLAFALALGCAVGGEAAAAGARPKVVIAKSSNFSAYASVVAGFSAEAHAEIEEITLPESAQAIEKAVEEIGKKHPALVLAIGPSAATAARRQLSDVPILFTMVPYYERYGLEAANVTGIALTNDLSVELATLAAVAPDRRRVGILHDPRYSRALIDEARAYADGHDLVIVPLETDSPQKAAKVLAGARGKVDALLMIADKTVANAAVVRKLIEFAQDQRIPLVGLSASQVKEGALLSLSPSYTGIGQQAGRLANRIIHEKVDPGALAVAQPETLDLAVNLTTAKKLGAGCDLALEIFKFAARRGYPVKVFE